MDDTLLKQRVGKWNEACRFLKGKQAELSVEEWSAIEVLADYWRNTYHTGMADECEEMIAVLVNADKYHSNNKEIITWSKEFRGIAKQMYTKDKETFVQFQQAMMQLHQGNRPRPTPRPSSSVPSNDVLIKQNVQKWLKAFFALHENWSSLDEEEQSAIQFIVDAWGKPQLTDSLRRECEQRIAVLVNGDRLHGNNKNIILHSKDFRSIAKLYISKGNDLYQEFSRAVSEQVATMSNQQNQQNRQGGQQRAQSPVAGPSVRIVEADFCDSLGTTLLSNFGNKIDATTHYLTPRIRYQVLQVRGDVDIWYKIYDPSGNLMMAEGSRNGYTWHGIVQANSIGNGEKILGGYGNNERNIFSVPGNWRIEFYENDTLLYKTSFIVVKKQASHTSRRSTVPTDLAPKKKRKGCLSWLLFLLLALGCGYQFWYKDYKRDVDAPRSYVFATNLFLRSSQVADVEYNRLGTIAYGSELITYSNEGGWAYVKANGQKGYVASDYLLGAEEFSLLNGVWGNDDAKEVVATAKCRKAILDFLKSGNLQTGNNGWQLYAKPKEMKPNSVSYPQLNDGYDHFTEFAFILKDNQSGKRKLALYAFEENETPVFRYAEDAPAKGDIKAVTYSKWNNRYRVTYSGQEAVYTPPVKKEAPKEPEPAVSSRSIDLVKVDFANGTNKGVLLTGYGQQLYSDMQYLQSRVAYKKRRAGRETFLLKVNIIRPDGTPIRGATSPADCTFERNVALWQEEGSFELTGWGSPESDVYPAGTYRYEIWHNGEKLSSSTINVESRVVVSTEVADDRIYESVDQMPEFPNGGMKGLMQYLSKNVKYPAVARERGVQGRVPVQFVINQDGSITDVTVVGGVDPYLDKEAVRVIKSMPKWRPGKKDGKAVRVKYTVPISFKLN